MQVTFEVKESCTVQTTQTGDKHANTAPAVTCQLNSAYQAQATTAPAASSNSKAATAEGQQAADGVWTITF
jgi:hypothetical protein